MTDQSPVLRLSPDSSPGVIDVTLESKRLPSSTGLINFIILLCVLLTCIIVCGVPGIKMPPFLIVILLVTALTLTIVLSLRVQTRRSRRRIAASLADLASAPHIRDALNHALQKPTTSNFDLVAEELAARLTAAGRVGECVRVCRKLELFDDRPIAEAFEPVKLNSSDPAFREFVAAIDQTDPPSLEDDPTRRQQRNPSEHAGRLMIDLFIVAFCVVLILNPGGIAPKAIGGLMLAAWTATRIIPALVSERQRLLVPGGLLVRKAPGIGKAWQTHLFARQSSVLVIWSIERRSAVAWKALIRSGDAKESMTLNGEESELLLRAWLSPVAPPDPNQLADIQ